MRGTLWLSSQWKPICFLLMIFYPVLGIDTHCRSYLLRIPWSLESHLWSYLQNSRKTKAKENTIKVVWTLAHVDTYCCVLKSVTKLSVVLDVLWRAQGGGTWTSSPQTIDVQSLEAAGEKMGRFAWGPFSPFWASTWLTPVRRPSRTWPKAQWQEVKIHTVTERPDKETISRAWWWWIPIVDLT